MLQRTVSLPFPLDLRGTVGRLRRGRHDPTCRFDADGFWRASRAPGGPATLHLVGTEDRVEARAWGDGAAAALASIEDLIGLTDDVAGFAPGDRLVARLWRDFGHRRIPRSLAIAESLVASVLEQRVTVFEARRSHQQMVARWGEDAPGPADLRLPPNPEVLAGLAYYDLHMIGVERKRADTVRRVAASARWLDDLAALAPHEAQQRLLGVVGVGPWTAAEVALCALGDPDAVPIGDIHLPAAVTYALTGTAIRSDDAMLEALAPYQGHRGRVIGLIGAAGIRAPRRAPRYSPRDIRGC